MTEFFKQRLNVGSGTVFRRAFWWMVVGGAWCLLAGSSVVRAQEVPAPVASPTPPPVVLREAWVPAESLETVLKRYPRAVALDSEQLRTLIHDAQTADPAVDPATRPPVRAVLRQARFDARPANGPDGGAGTQVQVAGDFEIESFSDAWTEVPVGLANVSLGTATLDDGHTPASLRRRDGKPDAPAALLLQGRGAHRLHVDFLLPVETRPDGNRITLPGVSGAAEFRLHLPPNARVESSRGCAVEAEAGAGVVARVTLRAAGEKADDDLLSWHTAAPTPDEAANLRQETQLSYRVEAATISARMELRVVPLLGRLPGSVRLPLPTGAHATQAEGGSVARWDLAADGLHIDLVPTGAPGDPAKLTVSYELPLTLDPAGAVARLDLPLPEIAGVHGAEGRVVLRRGEGVQVQRVQTSPIVVPVADASTDGEQAARETVGAYTVADLPARDHAAPAPALSVEARRTKTFFSVDADAQVSFPPGLVRTVRSLVFHVEEGTLFTARVALPKGETVTELSRAMRRPDWRQEGENVVLTWTAGVPAGAQADVQFVTQTDLTTPKPDAATAFHLQAATVPGAERLTGYVAVSSSPSLRVVTTGGDDRLERRDGRTTPVRGDVAWFYRDGFDLALSVERRAAEAEARFTGYALPQAGVVEIHGQIGYRFRFSGVELVKIRVPREVADAFFFTGPRVAERRLEGDVWTIRFQGEQTGDYALSVQGTIPSPADPADAGRFQVRLPTITPLETARWSGVWAVEANTDTEITFDAAGANETDALHAPALPDYQPRRRIIGVFEFPGGGTPEAVITLHGVRHPPAESAAAVVDGLELETLVATSGAVRQRATIRARTASDGFFNVHLPPGATLWSLTLDGTLTKPVVGEAGVLRVELPGGRAPTAASTVAVLYEIPDRPWRGAGRQTLDAPTFDPGVPVLNSRWNLHLPDGFRYSGFDSVLAPRADTPRPPDLLLSQLGSGLWRFLQGDWMPRRVFLAGHAQYKGAVSPDFDVAPEMSLSEPVQELVLPKTKLQSGNVQPSDEQSAIQERTRQLESIILPQIDFHDTTLSDAIDFIERETVRVVSGKEGQNGFNVYLKLPASGVASDPSSITSTTAEPAIPGLPVYSNGGSPPSPPPRLRVTLNMHDIPVLEALRYVATQAGLKVKVEGNTVAIVPISEATDALPSREFHVPPNFFQDNSSTPADQRPDAKTFLEASGVTFPPGASATYVATSQKLVVRNTQENVDLVAQLVEEFAAPTPTPNVQSQRRDSAGTASFNTRLASIIVPDIAFHDTSISEAVEFLRQESKRLDAEPDPNRRGINIFLKLPAAGTPGANSLPRITLTMHKMPLLEVLRYIANQGGLKVNVGEYAIEILPLTDVLVTTEVKISPELLADLAAKANAPGTGSVTIQRQDARTVLEASGVAFPSGASATYLASSGKLVMRNTQENIDLLETLITEESGAPADQRYSAKTADALLAGKGGGEAEALSNDPQEEARRVLARQPKIAGLLPMRLELPVDGFIYSFEGGGALGTLDFRYTDWRVAARWHWVWLTLGALGFLLGAAGWAHPWRRTLAATLALTFFPLVVAPGGIMVCNGLLAGWLWAVLGWVVTRVLLRRRRDFGRAVLPVLMACGMAAVVPTQSRADEPNPAPSPAGEMVIVPYDAKRPIAEQEKSATYYLPYERFLTLWDAAKRHRRPAAPEPPPGEARHTLDTARYAARLDGDGALQIDGILDFQTFGEEWVGVPLDFGGLQLGAVSLDGAPAPLDEGGKLWIGQPGAHRVVVSLSQPAGRIAAGVTLAWTVPPATAGTVSVLLARRDLRVELHTDVPGGGQVEEIGPEGGRLTGTAGGASRIELSFRDAPPVAPQWMLAPLAHVEARLDVDTQRETLHTEVRYTLSGNADNSFSVEFDASFTLTGLDAPDIREWHLLTDGGIHYLQVVTNAPAHDAYRFSFTADRPAAGTGERHFPSVSAGASRVELVGKLVAAGPVELSLPAGLPAGVRRVGAGGAAAGGEFAAFESDGNNRERPPVGALVYGVHPAPDKRAAHVNYLYQIGHGKIELVASVKLVRAAAGTPLLDADLRLPTGFAVQAVVGDAVKQWWTEGNRLSLRFLPAQGESVSLVVYLVQTFEHPPNTFALRPLVAEGFAETDGETLVAADRSFKVGLTLPTGGTRARDLTEIDAAQAAGEFQVRAPLERQRAFRYRGAEFDVPATLETLPAQSQVEWVTHATVRAGTVSVETHVNVRVRQGAVDALEFSLPGEAVEGRVSGPDVREAFSSALNPRDNAAGRSYRVLLQNPVYGGSETSFTVDLDLPLPSGGRVGLPDFAFQKDTAARDTGGFLLVENVSEGEMTLDAHGLDPAVEKDVPFVPAQTAAGTRFFRAVPGVPWTLTVGVTALEKSAGRAALVAYAELTSTLRPDGEEWHRAVYRLQNRRLQFLPVELPPGMEFIGAQVAGDAVRVDAGPAAEKGGAPTLLVPLVKTRPGELSYDVELVYRRPAPDPGKRREPLLPRWDMTDPRLPGVPVEKTLWDVYLPADARLLGQGGNVEPVVAALSQTEKLESSLNDLRSLSATYLSREASDEERQRALSNFNRLAGSVSSENNRMTARSRAGSVPQNGVVGGVPHAAQAAKRGEADVPADLRLLKRSEVASQSGLVAQKQEAIQNELRTLSTANSQASTVTPAAPQAVSGMGALNSISGTLSSFGGSTVAKDAAVNNRLTGPTQGVWRDQRGTDAKLSLQTNTPTALNQAAEPAQGSVQNNLALNDSVSVNLSRDDAKSSSFHYPTQFQPPQIPAKPQPQQHLSTARAQGTPGSELATPHFAQNREPAREPAAAAGALPAMVIQDGRSTAADAPTNHGEKLRATGRISLAVDFPQEGQVYHFKKVKDAAHLTLRSVRPARFVRLEYLLSLLLLVGGWWAAWAAGQRFRRGKVARPSAGTPAPAFAK